MNKLNVSAFAISLLASMRLNYTSIILLPTQTDGFPQDSLSWNSTPTDFTLIGF